MKPFTRFLSLFLALALCLPLFAACDRGDPAGADTTDASGSLPDPSVAYRALSVETYRDKTLAGFLSQLIGFLTGFEFSVDSSGEPRIAMPDSWFKICQGPYAVYNKYCKRDSRLVKNASTGLWDIYIDDDYSIDIFNQYILEDMYAQYGTFAARVIGEDWVKYNIYDMGGGNHSYGAYAIAKNKGYSTPFLGDAECGNRYSQCGEPYIANETLGMSAAGMPEVTADLVDLFAQVTGDRDSYLWARFFTVMYAMAYFETDLSAMIARAADMTLPEGTWQREVIERCFALKKKYGDDWRRAAKAADEELCIPYYGMESRVGETSINCAFILLGLIFGEGDYVQTLKIISLAGHGGDSTTPVGVGIVGVMLGMQAIPEEALGYVWQDGQTEIINRAVPDTREGVWMFAANLPERIKVADILDKYQKNFESILLENGGKIEDGVYYIPEEPQTKMDTVVIANYGFEDGTLAPFRKETGTVEAADPGCTGDYSLKLVGAEGGSSAATELSGLKVGETYRLTAYLFASTGTTLTLFAEQTDGTGRVSTALFDTQDYVRRILVFTASAETMRLGVAFDSEKDHKYALADNFTLVRIKETSAGSLSGENGSWTAVSDTDSEAWLKLTFTNVSGKLVNCTLKVDGQKYTVVPLRKTGKTVAEGEVNVVYVPLLLKKGEHTVSLELPKNVAVSDAQFVNVTERFPADPS
ncbi:MAG: ADP-ribosylglycohydrolase family protein [Clostridia bacterium]|nr:ADP-ribosylglycohydrolase family protein [Clostridia bacterium]